MAINKTYSDMAVLALFLQKQAEKRPNSPQAPKKKRYDT